MKPHVIVLEVNVLPSTLWINFWIGLAKFYVTIPFIIAIEDWLLDISRRLIRVKVKRKYGK